MNVYMTEEEQVELIKKWWTKYGNLVTSVLLAVVLGMIGYRWYNNHQQTLSSQASEAYSQLMTSVANNDSKAAMSDARFIKETYPATPYGVGAAMLLAKNQLDQKNWADAITEYQWVIANAKQVSLKQLARIRLSRVYVYQKSYAQALSVLNAIDDTNMTSLIYEQKGDVLVAQGEIKKASNAYHTAVAALPKASMMTKTLQRKIALYSEKHSHYAVHSKPKSTQAL